MAQEEPRQDKDAPQDRSVPVIWVVVVSVVLLATLSVLIVLGYIYRWEWVGVGETYRPKPTDQDIRRGKTLWDWMQLLIVPVAVAIGSFVLNQTAKRRDDKAQAEQRRREEVAQKTQKEREEALADRRAQDTALQSYLDQMSALLIDTELAERLHDLNDKQGNRLRVLARARTLTVLGQLDGIRKGNLMQFLYEADLINKDHPAVSLRSADLSTADLSYAILSGADLSGANLSGANLIGAYLTGADLNKASLREADLRGAILRWTDLNGADLSEADLSEARYVTQKQLETCKSLAGVTIPVVLDHD